MKLIIDIPKEDYQRIKEYYEKNNIVEETYSYIVHGIPLEEKTNGDMINALFPRTQKNIRVDGGYPLNFIIEWEWHRNLKEWWDSPYEEGVKWTDS